MNKKSTYLPNDIENMLKIYFKNNLKQLLSEVWEDIQLDQQYAHNAASSSSLHAKFIPNSVPSRDQLGHIHDSALQTAPYGIQTRDIASAVTSAVMNVLQMNYANNGAGIEQEIEMDIWKRRPINVNLSILYVDFMKLQTRGSSSIHKFIYFIVGVTDKGYREIIDICLAPKLDYPAWKEIFMSLRNRGLRKILIGVFHENNCIKEAFCSVYPYAAIQRSFSFMLKETLRKIEKHRQPEFVDDVKKIYQASTREDSIKNFKLFLNKWKSTAPAEMHQWEKQRSLLLTFYDFPDPIRCNLYNTNWMKQTISEFRSQFKLIPHQPASEPIEHMILRKVNEFNGRWSTRRLKGFKEASTTLRKMLNNYKRIED